MTKGKEKVRTVRASLWPRRRLASQLSHATKYTDKGTPPAIHTFSNNFLCMAVEETWNYFSSSYYLHCTLVK